MTFSVLESSLVRATENVVVENAGVSKKEGVKIAGVEIAAPECRGEGVENTGETSMVSQNSRYLTLLSSRALH